jgi:hypothetical protein
MRLVAAALIALTGCPDEPGPIDPRDCTGDPRATLFTPGLEVQSTSGLFRAQLTDTSPPTPDRGVNVWELAVASDTSTSVDMLRVKAWMPDHGHGTRPLWNESELLPVSGRRRVGPFNLFMPGLWQFTIEATIDGVTEEAIVAFCIQEDPNEQPDAGSGDASIPIECNVTAPTACEDDSLTYEDVQPILQEKCIGCHNGAGENWPLTDYDHVADWFSEIRGMMLACTMPPPDSPITMSDEERELILHWIRCGYPAD